MARYSGLNAAPPLTESNSDGRIRDALPVVLRYLPDVAANSLSGITEAGSPQYLSQTPATFVVAIWVIGTVAAAAFVLNRRDV